MFRNAVGFALAVVFAAASATGAAAEALSSRGAAAGNTRIMLFNQTPAASYAVRRNNVSSGTVIAAPSGLVVYETNAITGDRFEFLASGVSPVVPSPPSGLVATGSTQGCVSAAWNAPAASDYVTDYSLLWKTGSGAFTDSVAVDGADVAKGAKWVAGHCGLANGTYVFALRAHNAFDRWSRLSAASTATISNQDAQGPLPPTHLSVAKNTSGCPTVSWTRSSDPGVAGYRVYWGTRPRAQAAYGDSLEAGNASSATLCELSEGNYYLALRAYTAAGAMSAYTRELVLGARVTNAALPGAIVPDGYWSNDVTRPLEIRDLPARWTVRIFDISGACVRRHENQTTGATWTWDFHNEKGTRVAPALYLVRVTDASGSVQRSGRFLVQPAP